MTRKPKHTLDAAVHPAADLFPLLDDEELAILAEDIKRHGLYLPIVLDTEGRILDGRNRARACAIAGVEPRTVVYDGDRPELYVLSANAYRRHMTTGARAMATALVLKASGKRRGGRWVRGSIPAIPDIGNSAWRNAMTQAGLVVDAGDHDLAKAVINGDTYLHVAVELVTPRSAAPEVIRTPATIDEAVPRLNQLGEEIAELEEARKGVAGVVIDAAVAEVEDLVDAFEEQVDALVDDAEEAAATPKRPRSREVLNPAQRRERRAVRESAEETALASLALIRSTIERLDLALHDHGIDQVTGKPRHVLADELERLATTIRWALGVLGRQEGE